MPPRWLIAMRFAVGAFALAFAIALAARAAAGDVSPQVAPKLAQKILQRFDVPGTTYETILLRVEFPANYEVSRHSHPGPQASYVLFGEMTLSV